MHEIKIYGDIVHASSKDDNNVSLADVQNQLSTANGKDIKVRIGSDGGDANEGFAIYNELRRYAKENNAKVHTFAESRLSSIATVIFLAGDERELSADLQPFVHSAYIPDSEKVDDKQQAYLDTVNNRIAQHYANHTDLTFDEAMTLMKEETFINTEEAKSMRFATSIENVLRPVALQRFNHKQNENMNNNKKTTSALAKAIAFIKSLGAINKILYDATGTEIDFYELGDDEIAEVGSKARVDGKDADGSYVMSDGATYIFVAGELKEIVVKAEDVNEEAVALQATIDELTNQLEKVTNASQDTITAKDTVIENLTVENKKLTDVIANYKNSKSPLPDSDPKSPNYKGGKQEGIAAKAIESFINKKPLKVN